MAALTFFACLVLTSPVRAQTPPASPPVPAGSSDSGRPVVIAADRWCPVNCLPGREEAGYAIDMAREAYALEGYRLEYRVMPWGRAIEAARAGRLDGIVGTLVVNTPDFVFPQETIGESVSVFFIREDSPWRYRGVRTLETQVIAVANEYLFGDPFDGYVARHRRDPAKVVVLYSRDPVRQGLEMLAARRVDAYVDDRVVVRWTLRGMTDMPPLRETGELNHDPLYIAFSPSSPRAKPLADAFDRGVRKLRASGRLAQILSRYGVSDWGPARRPPAEQETTPGH